MQTICAWCGKVLKEGEGDISHGICPACWDEHFPSIKRRIKVRVYLDQAIEILQKTHDGNDLDPKQLKRVLAAIIG